MLLGRKGMETNRQVGEKVEGVVDVGFQVSPGSNARYLLRFLCGSTRGGSHARNEVEL